jgi:hypothetical protein
MSLRWHMVLVGIVSAYVLRAVEFPYVETLGGAAAPAHVTNVTYLARCFDNYSMGLQANGTVISWGAVPHAIPGGLPSLKSVEGAADFSIGLLSNGTVTGWGQNGAGATPPTGLSNVTAISAGQYHAVALKSDGTVAVWGLNNYQQLNVPAGLSNVTTIAAGDYCTLVVLSNGTVTGWGYNAFGKLNIPAEATNVIAIAVYEHCLALRKDGTVIGWGRNDYGQASAAFISNAAALRTGVGRSVVLHSNGTITAWGAMGVRADLNSRVVALSATEVLTLRPKINAPPVGLDVLPGSSGSFSISATGTTALTYQWFKNEVLIAGETNNTFSIAAVTTNDAGFYSVSVSDQLGGVRQSDLARLIVNGITVLTSPSNITAVAGQSAVFTAWATSTVAVAYQWQKDGTNIPGATNNSLTIINAQGTDAGTYRVLMSASTTVVTREAALSVIYPPSIVQQPTNTAIWGGVFANFYVVATGTPPLSFQWQKDGGNVPFSGTSSNYAAPSVDAGKSFRVRISNSAGTIFSSNVTFYDNSIWLITYSASAYEGDNAVFSAGVSGGGPLSFQWRRNGTDIAGATNLTLVLSNVTLADRGSAFSFACTSLGGTRSTPNATLSVWRRVPAITEQPQSVTANVGDSVSVGVVVDAAPSMSISYQWIRNGTNVPGAISNVLHYPNVQLGNAGDHFVIVNYTGTNGSGSLTSTVAAVTVIDRPWIIQQPTNIQANAGENISFSIIATSSAPVTYQWDKNGAGLLGETNSLLVFSSVSSNDIGAYRVVVSNTVGGLTRTSAVAILVLHTIPVFLAQPISVNAHAFGDSFFSVTVTSATAVAFTWRKDGVILPGGDGATLVFKHLRFSDAGTYDVIAATPAGSATSAPVTLTVSSNRPQGTVISLGGPMVPPGLTNAVAISAGPHLNTATLADGSVHKWTDRTGYYLFGGGETTEMTNILSVVSGDLRAYALNESDAVLNWGGSGSPSGVSNVIAMNFVGDLSFPDVVFADGTMSSYSVPTGVSNIVAAATWPNYGVALLRNGNVISWPTFTPASWEVIDSNVISITSGSYTALNADGRIRGGPLDGLTNVVAMAARCCLALLSDGTVVTADNSRPATNAFALSTSAKHSLVLTTNPPTPIISASLASNAVTVETPISVSGYILESATNITGPYTPFSTFTNDLLFPVGSESRRFFRLRKN